MRVEEDPSGRAKCCECEDKIEKGSKRLIEKVFAFNRPSELKYCRVCAISYLGGLMSDLDVKSFTVE